MGNVTPHCVADLEPCECEATHRPGILAWCSCACHNAPPLTPALFWSSVLKLAGRRHLS